MLLDDISAVLEIERLSFTTPWPSEAFQQEISRNRMARYVIAWADERVVGYAGIWLMVDDAHITTFGVHPDWRRRGIGRQLLSALLVQADELGAAEVTLEVRVSNLAAQNLYRGQGFRVTGRRPRYYTDDGEDAFVMATPPLASPPMRAAVAAARRSVALERDR